MITVVKRLGKSLGAYRKDTALTPVFVAFEVAMDIAIPFLMATLIDDGIDAGDMGVIWRMGALIALLALLAMGSGALAGMFSARASAGLAANLRRDMYYNVQRFSFSNLDKFSTASLVTRLTTDVTNVQFSFMMVLRIAARAPLLAMFAMIMSAGINPQIALIFICVVPVLVLFLYLIIHKAHPIFVRVFETYDKLNRVVQENLRGIRVVKAFVREDYEREKFAKISDLIYKDFSRAERLVVLNMPLMQLSAFACILAASWVGARLIVAGEMTTGQLMSVMVYTMQILISMMMLSMAFVMIIISRASAERISEVLAEESDMETCAEPVHTVQDGSIRFENVDFSYAKDPEKLCLFGVNLEIRPGQTVGIIGGTGSSKSSLIQLIPRLYDTTGGTVYVGGVDVRQYDLEALRSQVAVVLQKNMLFSGTIRENLRWGDPDADDGEIARVCRLAQADDFIRAFPEGYDTLIDQGGANLSGGQRQRLCIARALLKKPKILILDDSTSAVDTRTDSLIRKAFREELPDTTKLIITQRAASVQDADLIIVLDGGRVSASGTHETLLRDSEIYREVYSSQMEGGAANGAET